MRYHLWIFFFFNSNVSYQRAEWKLSKETRWFGFIFFFFLIYITFAMWRQSSWGKTSIQKDAGLEMEEFKYTLTHDIKKIIHLKHPQITLPSIPYLMSLLKWTQQRPSPNKLGWTSLVVQWLRLRAPNVGGLGSIPGLGTRYHMPQLRPDAVK